MAERIEAGLRGARAVVVGALGFIGTRLAAALSEAGAAVAAIVRDPRGAGRLKPAKAEIRVARLEDAAALARALEGAELVFNLAYDFKASAQDNVAAFRGLADACAKAGARRLVHASSIVVYDDFPARDVSEESSASGPAEGYRAAKREMERDLAARAGMGFSSAIIQPTLVYGPGSFQWTDTPVERLLAGPVVLPDEGAGLCNAVFVDDVAAAMALAATADIAPAERFVVSAAEPVTWRAFYQAYAEILGTGSILGETAEALAARHGGPGRSGPSPLAGLAQKGIGLARAIAGKEAVERARAIAAGLARRRGPVPQYPSPHELDLYLARGRCRIERARARLGYAPQADLAAGMALTADYIRAKYGREVR